MKKICDIGTAGIKLISGAVVLALFLSNVLFTSYVNYQDERVSIETDGLFFLVPGALIVLMGYWLVRRKLPIKEWHLFLAGSVIWLCAGVYFVAHCDGTLRFDPLYCYEAALEMNAGDYSALCMDGYLYYCPHQLGFVTYERILLALGGQTRTILGVNFLWTIGIQFLLWRLSDLLSRGNPRANMATIVFGFCFLPLFLFGMFAYGMIPGLFFLLGAFYGAVVWQQKGGLKYLVFMTVCCVAAVLLKENYLIGAVAITIWGLLASGGKRSAKGLALFALLIPVCLLSIQALRFYYLWESGETVNSGIPTTLYIGMGINIDNESAGPGWYDGTVWSYYTDCGQDSAAASELAWQNLRIYIQRMQAEPVRTVKFFLRKMVSMWCDPLYDSVWSGPMEANGQYCDTAFLQSLYRGGTVDTICRWLMKAYVPALLGLCGIYCIRRRTAAEGADMLFLYTVGGFLFHLFWEAKSQYAFPYVCILIPIAGCALAEDFSLKRDRK